MSETTGSDASMLSEIKPVSVEQTPPEPAKTSFKIEWGDEKLKKSEDGKKAARFVKVLNAVTGWGEVLSANTDALPKDKVSDTFTSFLQNVSKQAAAVTSVSQVITLGEENSYLEDLGRILSYQQEPNELQESDLLSLGRSYIEQDFPSDTESTISISIASQEELQRFRECIPNIAHDFKNPLTVVKGLADIRIRGLKKTGGQIQLDTYQSTAKNIQEALERMNRTIEDWIGIFPHIFDKHVYSSHEIAEVIFTNGFYETLKQYGFMEKNVVITSNLVEGISISLASNFLSRGIDNIIGNIRNVYKAAEAKGIQPDEGFSITLQKTDEKYMTIRIRNKGSYPEELTGEGKLATIVPGQHTGYGAEEVITTGTALRDFAKQAEKLGMKVFAQNGTEEGENYAETIICIPLV